MLWFVKLYKSFVEKKTSIHEKYSPNRKPTQYNVNLKRSNFCEFAKFPPIFLLEKKCYP